jgi:hypothetical protein
MALTNSDIKDIEVIVRKEVKDFLGQNTIKQYEDRLLDTISKEIRDGKLEGDVKDIIIKVFREFYYQMWANRGQWEPRLKNA